MWKRVRGKKMIKQRENVLNEKLDQYDLFCDGCGGLFIGCTPLDEGKALPVWAVKLFEWSTVTKDGETKHYCPGCKKD